MILGFYVTNCLFRFPVILIFYLAGQMNYVWHLPTIWKSVLRSEWGVEMLKTRRKLYKYSFKCCNSMEVFVPVQPDKNWRRKNSNRHIQVKEVGINFVKKVKSKSCPCRYGSDIEQLGIVFVGVKKIKTLRQWNDSRFKIILRIHTKSIYVPFHRWRKERIHDETMIFQSSGSHVPRIIWNSNFCYQKYTTSSFAHEDRY